MHAYSVLLHAYTTTALQCVVQRCCCLALLLLDHSANLLSALMIASKNVDNFCSYPCTHTCTHVKTTTAAAATTVTTDHPGYNNAFAVATQTKEAVLYSDDSVLERHHAFKTFELLRSVSNTHANTHEHCIC
jgi:3'5'-cyclic nucleotide phosphodiesterase